MNLYCVKCRKHTDTNAINTITTKNKRQALSGFCNICGIKKFKFIQKKKGGDLATKLAKLPGLPWSKYPGEKHLPGYSYCGPGTRLDIRLDGQQPRPGEYPINAIDKACHAHDVAYLSDDLQHRHIADVKLIHALNAITDKTLKEKLASWLIKTAMKGKLMLGSGVEH
jgi:hypothetical protein